MIDVKRAATMTDYKGSIKKLANLAARIPHEK
jgi:hypothetical protein